MNYVLAGFYSLILYRVPELLYCYKLFVVMDHRYLQPMVNDNIKTT